MATDAPDEKLSAAELSAYLGLIEVSSLVRHEVEQQLREAGDLSYVQFQLLATLGSAPSGTRRMTELADGVVYSRSGLTYQIGLLERAGLVVRAASQEDERGVAVTATEAGMAALAAVFPGHLEVVRRLLFDALEGSDVENLARILGKVRDGLRHIPPRSATRTKKESGGGVR